MKRRSVAALVGGSLAGLTGWDLLQRRHTILRNYPIIGHLRFLLEAVGPELRQYIVTDNDAERPFSRDQRRWVYTSSKLTNRYFGFGTDNDLERVHNYPIIKHAAFPVPAPDGEPNHPDPAMPLPAAKVLGGARGRAKAFRPSSLVNVSGMSFGSLSAAAVTALNKPVATSTPPLCPSTRSSFSMSTSRPCRSTSCSTTSPAGACPARPTSKRSPPSWRAEPWAPPESAPGD
jgi:hypothetical protein